MGLRATEERPLSPADTAWLRMDRPENRLVIHALFELAEPIRRQDVETLVRERLLTEPRFRSRVVPGPLRVGVPRFREVEELDLGRHVRCAVLDDADPSALVRFAGRRMGERLDHRQPLWELDVVEDWRGRGALLAKLHHCIGDGVTLIRLLLRLTEQGDGESPQRVGQQAGRARGPTQLLRNGLHHTQTLARLLLLPSDPHTALHTQLGEEKRAAWSRPIPLSDVRDLGHRLDARVNDVVMAALAGALRRHLEERGSWHPGLEVRALTPVFIRGRRSQHLGNHFGMVFVPLPLGVRDARERIGAVRDRTRAIKASDEATVAMAVIGGLGLASRRIQRLGVNLFTSKASVMATNVPGPAGRVSLAGRRVDGMVVWAPVSGRIGLGVSVLSYAGEIRVGVASDARLADDPARLVGWYEEEMEQALRPPPSPRRARA